MAPNPTSPVHSQHRHKSHHHHGGLHPHHLSTKASGSSETAGWVEGITRLTEDHAATALVASDPSPLPSVITPTQAATPPSSFPAASLTPQEEFDSKVKHALETLESEVNRMGESIVEFGTPDGFGPTGLDDAQLDELLSSVKEHANVLGAQTTEIRRRRQPSPQDGAKDMATADICVRRRPGEGVSPLELRVAIVGNVDSGKSTMVGVLTRSMLDDGRGSARSKVFKHNHEVETGRTSAISQHTLCLDESGNVLNDPAFRTTTTADYVARSAKILTLVDLAGHEKYLKTTCHGLTGHFPDYAACIVGANAGLVGMSKEHLGVALALRVPVFFIITKIDLAPAHVTQHTLTTLQSILKKPGVKKRPFVVRTRDDVVTCARHMHTDSLAPIFLTSCVTGEGLDFVRLFYNLLPQRVDWAERAHGLAEFVIDETFGVPGVGTVVAGTVKRGVLTPNTPFLLGPDIGDGSFNICYIKSIHYKRLAVPRVIAGQTAALALKKVKRCQVRKGMVLVAEAVKPEASWEFDADIAILTHSTTIQPRYQAVIHCEIVRQSARVVAMDKRRLRSGDRSTVRFRFMNHPEYLVPGSRFVFREGRTKGIGVIVATNAAPEPTMPEITEKVEEEDEDADVQQE
jgi:GTPase